MTNFIPADKLKEEIKRWIKVEIEECYKSKNPQFFKFGIVNTLENLIPFINSLQQKQPEVDLEKEIEETVVTVPCSEFTHECEYIELVDWLKDKFRYFYNLGLNSTLDAI